MRRKHDSGRGLWRRALLLAPMVLTGGMSAAAEVPAEPVAAKVLPAHWKGALPDVLTAIDGTPIAHVAEWESKRRPELLDLFASQIYGRAPAAPPQGIEFKVLERSDDALNGKAIRIQGTIVCQGVQQPTPFLMLVYLPKHAEGPVPVFLGLNFMGNQVIAEDPAIIIPEWKENPRPRGRRVHRYDLDKILDAGYGIATIHTADIEPDRPGMWNKSIRSAFSTEAANGPDGWATLAAWAWGLSRGLDALLTLPEVDPNRVIVWGHSRLGKTALWAGATDPRFAAVISNNSGCGGAGLSRYILDDDKSENLARITRQFPHWFAPNFLQYVDREETLPVDQHELIALIAPRPVLVTSAEEDVWANPEAEFFAVRAASPVYRLYNFPGIAPEASMPPLTVLTGERAGYYIRPGIHDVTSFDWGAYIDFMNRSLGPTGVK